MGDVKSSNESHSINCQADLLGRKLETISFGMVKTHGMYTARLWHQWDLFERVTSRDNNTYGIITTFKLFQCPETTSCVLSFNEET